MSTTLTTKVEKLFEELLFAEKLLCEIYDALEECHEDSNLSREIGVFAKKLKDKEQEFQVFRPEAIRLKNWLCEICSGIISIEEARHKCAEFIQDIEDALSYFKENAFLEKKYKCNCRYSDASNKTDLLKMNSLPILMLMV